MEPLFRANVRFSITMKVTLRRGRQQRAINVRIHHNVRFFIELLAKFQEPRLLCCVNVSNKRPNLRGNTLRFEHYIRCHGYIENTNKECEWRDDLTFLFHLSSTSVCRHGKFVASGQEKERSVGKVEAARGAGSDSGAVPAAESGQPCSFPSAISLIFKASIFSGLPARPSSKQSGMRKVCIRG